LETSLVTWTFGGDATVLADYALTTTTTLGYGCVCAEISLGNNAADVTIILAFVLMPLLMKFVT